MPAPAEVTLLSDTEIQVTRTFDAPRDLVYLAFTTPTLVQRWLLGPPGWSMPICEMDLRVGGNYRYRWRQADTGTEFGFHGSYDAVEPRLRIVSREWPDGPDTVDPMRVATFFTDLDDGRTRVEYRMTARSKALRDAAIGTGMTDGMEMSFRTLDGVLAAGIR